MAGDSSKYDADKSDAERARLVEALPGFKVADALARLNGNICVYKELLADLSTNLAASLSTLRPLIQSGAIKEALIHLHSLKGMSANLGAMPLSRAFEKMEQALSTSRKKQDGMLITHMEQAIQQSLSTISAFLQADPLLSVNPPPPDASTEDPLAETMNLLARLLDQERLDAVDAFKRLKRLMHHQPPHPAFNTLAAAMERLDYATARKALTALADSINPGI